MRISIMRHIRTSMHLVALLSLTPIATHANEPTPKPGTVLVQERVDQQTLQSSTLASSEQGLQDLLKQEAANRFAGRLLTPLNPRNAAMEALQKNLDVRRNRLRREVADQALAEAKALFNPVLNLSVSYGQSQTFQRIERATIFRRATTVDKGGNNVLANPDPNGDRRNPKAVFNDSRPDQVGQARIPASLASPTGPARSMNYQIDLSQQLPWGANLLLSYKALDQDTFFVNNSAVLRTENPPPNFKAFGSYGRPWVSSFLTRLSIPLPGSRFFGPYAEQDVAVKLAYLGQEQAYWDVQTQINTTLRDVDLAYWDLVDSLLNIQILHEDRKTVRQLREKTLQLFKTGLATNYDQAQVDAEVARVEGQVEQAWNNYVQRSNELARLLDRSTDGDLLVPSGYSQALASAYKIPHEPATPDTSTDNPGMIAAALNVNAAQIERERRRVRTRQDVSLNAQVNLLQSNRVFGYDSFGASAENVFDPDIVEQSYSVDFRYPWGNRAVHARLGQAEAGLQKQELALRATDNRVQRELHSGYAGLNSANARVEITARNIQLAELAYAKALQQQELRGVTEYEVAEQNKRLLQARLAHVAARTQRKQAEARVLAAMGIFANVYAERYAQTDVDRYRLQLLAANHALHYFGKQP
jgi:outer membrane protein TolC